MVQGQAVIVSPDVTLATDGASRGNPGPASVAYAIYRNGEGIVEEHAETIGKATNNEAEYRALIAGLEAAALHTGGIVHHVSDSELLVKQLEGLYSINAANLEPLVQLVEEAARRFQGLQHTHVGREDERIEHVDGLANEALDEAE
ncbi:ribonuclease H [Thermoplasmatales archaeon SW_10_69_26]|nr:MAG: ribonuclease H [Thermoplasmatales archaeon SW_10_69_26]